MKVVNTIEACRKEIASAKGAKKSIGFVPTMGYLHEGHMSLIRKCVSENNFSVVSIFVNPTQFGPQEDLERYPRDLERDTQLCEKAGCDLIFAPSVEEMYPKEQTVFVEETRRSVPLCGLRRPGHFRGVATVVVKLLNIVSPNRVYFGAKDAQQAAVIDSVIEQLNMPVKMVVCPTVREEDGLAMSSRNSYLSTEGRAKAPHLFKALTEIKRAFDKGKRDARTLEKIGISYLARYPEIQVEYLEIRDYPGLNEVNTADSGCIAAIAAYIEGCRLIDNIRL